VILSLLTHIGDSITIGSQVKINGEPIHAPLKLEKQIDATPIMVYCFCSKEAFKDGGAHGRGTSGKDAA